MKTGHFRDMVKAIPPLHVAGRPFVLLFAAFSAGLGLWSESLFWLGLILTVWCAAFFRDPERVRPKRKRCVISPADGIILPLTCCSAPEPFAEKGVKMRRISIFMSIFDVHVNRIPCDGKIEDMVYRPGSFVNASFDKASTKNERMLVRMTPRGGGLVIFAQIAGFIARRIVCGLEKGQTVQGGERFGMIRFGSRVDVYLPMDARIEVRSGQRAVGGETVLASLAPRPSLSPKNPPRAKLSPAPSRVRSPRNPARKP